VIDDLQDVEARLRREAGDGDVDAMCDLGVLLAVSDRGDEAERWLTRAAQTGDAGSMSNLGNLLRLHGCPVEAEPWLRRAAAEGNLGGVFNLGVLYEDLGRAGDAETLYRQAASCGHAGAMTNLGNLLAGAGEGAEAERWWGLAAGSGDLDAIVNLGRLLSESGRETEANRWYWWAAAAGDDDAAAWLRSRDITPPDPESFGEPPSLIAIDHDDYHAEHIGHTADGRQFFLTTPFVPLGDEFVALFLFDRAGQLIDAKVDNFGPRDTLDDNARRAVYETRLCELGDVTFGRIEVAPFAVERFGIAFGLIVRDPDVGEDDDVWAVELQPGNYMAFFEPWDSGIYDT